MRSNVMILILVVMLSMACALSLRQHEIHEYWFNYEHPLANDGDDSEWDYCDLKCLYLERYAPGIDMVVIVMTAPLK